MNHEKKIRDNNTPIHAFNDMCNIDYYSEILNIKQFLFNIRHQDVSFSMCHIEIQDIELSIYLLDNINNKKLDIRKAFLNKKDKKIKKIIEYIKNPKSYTRECFIDIIICNISQERIGQCKVFEKKFQKFLMFWTKKRKLGSVDNFGETI